MKHQNVFRASIYNLSSQSKSLLIAIAMLIVLPSAVYAQNPLMKMYKTRNNSIDYMSYSNEYLLSGSVFPTSIGGMSNIFGTRPLSRIQMQTFDDRLSCTMLKTYCTLGEVNDVANSVCPALSVAFFAEDAKQTMDSGFIICGYVVRSFETNSCGGDTYSDPFLLRLSKTGAVVWYKRYPVNRTMAGGILRSVVEDPATGNFIACGKTSSSHGYVMGVDASGTLQWAHDLIAYRAVGGAPTSSEYTEITPFVDQAGQQVYALTGSAGVAFSIAFFTNYGGGLLTVIDANGTVNKNVQITLDPFALMNLHGIADAHDGTVVLTGFSGGNTCGAHDGWNLMIMKIEPYGLTTNFAKIYQVDPSNMNTASGGVSIVVNSAADTISVTGHENLSGSSGGYFGMFAQTNMNGNALRYLRQDATHTVVGTGITYNTAGLFPVYAGSAPNDYSFLVKDNYGYDCKNDTSVQEAIANPTFVDNYMADITIEEIDESLIAYNLIPEKYIACGYSYRQQPASIKSAENGANMQISPNPASEYVDIMLSAGAEKGSIHIYDLQGRLVLTQAFGTKKGSVHVNTSTLTPGVYSVSIDDGNGIRHTRFIKQ
jgi:hypothetical protein